MMHTLGNVECFGLCEISPKVQGPYCREVLDRRGRLLNLWHMLGSHSTPPVAFSESRLTGRENASDLKTKSGWQSEVADLIVNVFLKYPSQVSLS